MAFPIAENLPEMKLLFSEARPDYGHYIFPYAIWAFPEPGETAGDLFNHGFLPSSRDLDRFYLARHVRVGLQEFKPSSENRRVLRKGKGIEAALVPRGEFQFTAARREFYKDYADKKFGKDVMSYERLDALFEGKITSHVLLFTDTSSSSEVGTVTLYLEPPALAYYYYAFYDLNYYHRNLGMYMMTSAVRLFAERRFSYLYLGSCYLENALYKTQFAGAEFFNGVRWSTNLDELKHLVRRGQQEQPQHLLESEEYRRMFYQLSLAQIGATSAFKVNIR
jgi:arginyl-tRNA--protein-N-Asp/Glu arginylyltransferase